jgi:hypothetical protein
MHHCKYNRVADSCTCECWGALPKKHYPTSLHGDLNFNHPLSQDGFGNPHEYCKGFVFPKAFDRASSSQVRVLTTLSEAQGKYDSPAAWWVQSSSNVGFTACCQSPMHAKLRLQYFAFQMNAQAGPWSDSDSQSTWISPPAIRTDVHCQNIYFRHQFNSKPYVIGSVTRRRAAFNHNVEGALQFWVENIEESQFSVCFQAQPGARSTVYDSLYFNWIAFDHRNPLLWYRPSELPYSAAGRVAAGHKWVETSGFGLYNATVYRICKVVPFGRVFNVKPNVLVTSNRASSSRIDSGQKTASSTYVDAVYYNSFRVCSVQAQRPGKSDQLALRLQWDWVVFGSDVVDYVAS